MSTNMITKLSEIQLEVLHNEEPKLRKFCQLGDLGAAKDCLMTIQSAFLYDRNHRRLLTAKLLFGEALIDAGQTGDAREYATLVAQRANEGSRVFLDAIGLLSVCELRLGNLVAAQKHVVYVTKNSENIKSERKRIQFFVRLQSRIKDECIISQLISENLPAPDPEVLKLRVEQLVTLSDSELLEKLAIAVPSKAFNIALNIQYLVHSEISKEDQLRLPAPQAATSDQVKGNEILEAVRRVAWKTCCDQEKPFFKIWSTGLATIFGGAAFFKSITKIFTGWDINNSELIAAFSASLVKTGCDTFCDRLKPPSLMIPPHE